MPVVGNETFEVAGETYQSQRMSAFDQHAVSSKLGGVLLLMFDNMKKKRTMSDLDFARAFTVLSGDLRKDSMDEVFYLCLRGVTRKVEGDQGWASVLTEAQGIMAFSDIDMPEMLSIIWHVLKQHRIPDFFSEPLSKSTPKERG